MPSPSNPDFCPCDPQRRYAQCCGPLHEGALATSAEALMRSRYSAYVLGLETYLLDTWHPQHRPASLGLAGESPRPKWLGLKIVRQVQMDDDRAELEFVARYRIGGGSARRQGEISRFVRENDHWLYVDGVVS